MGGCAAQRAVMRGGATHACCRQRHAEKPGGANRVKRFRVAAGERRHHPEDGDQRHRVDGTARHAVSRSRTHGAEGAAAAAHDATGEVCAFKTDGRWAHRNSTRSSWVGPCSCSSGSCRLYAMASRTPVAASTSRIGEESIGGSRCGKKSPAAVGGCGTSRRGWGGEGAAVGAGWVRLWLLGCPLRHGAWRCRATLPPSG